METMIWSSLVFLLLVSSICFLLLTSLNIVKKSPSMKCYIYATLCIILLAPFGLGKAFGGNAQYTKLYTMTPLSTALNVLPPLGKTAGERAQGDQSLVDFLQITICQVNGAECTPVYEFTSRKILKGLDFIKLQNKFYHVNWDIPKTEAAGQTYKIHFIVAGLDIGEATFLSKKGETVPIKFHIKNHPRIRARILFEQGYSAEDIGQALISEFNLGAVEIAEILAAENFTDVEVGEVLLNLGFSPEDITLALRDVFNLDAYDAGLVLKDLGFSEFTIQSMLMDIYDVYAAIVHITSTVNNNPSQGPAGYTGLAFCSQDARCTHPYIPGLFGQFVIPSDINKGIGGDFRYVYAKYELVPKTSATPVVTGVKAVHWPYWNVSCPTGWVPVSSLTTGTIGACNRVGMCARYEPINNAQTFLTNLAVSFGDFGNPASKCSAVCGANANIWPLYTDNYDIHSACEDEHWVFFCYNQAETWPARPTTIAVSDNEKLAQLEQYAPRVFMHPGENFYPSSVEWSFDHLFRYSPSDLPGNLPPYPNVELLYHVFPQPDDKYYVSPKQMIGSPSDWLEYHHGCNGSATANPCQLSDVRAYGFWNKQTIPWAGEQVEVIDLTYFFYYPYNRGKEYFNTVWGNHVGDWEHVTVRLSWVYDPLTGWEIKPIHLFVAAHDFGTSHPWDTVTKVPGTDHPIVYSAHGSHGNYVGAGTQRYGKIVKLGITIAFLYDFTGGGLPWDTWNNLQTLDYDDGKGLGTSIWPRWMSTNYTDACGPDNLGCDPYDPENGPIYRWGTYEFGSCDITCRMAKGPTGPVDKGIWDNPYEP